MVGVCTDNAANQLLGVRLAGQNSIRCSAHTIQLAIQDAIKNVAAVSALLEKSKKIVKHIRKSGPAKLALRKVSHLKYL